MKKHLFLLVLITFAFLSEISAQDDCLPDGKTFSTQAQIDSFQDSFPNCTKILGDVIISGNDITDLSGLDNIDKVEGSLFILDNASLVSLDGLNNIDSIKRGCKIAYNDSLSSLNGLGSLSYVGMYTYYTNLDNMHSFGLEIQDNPSLTSLSGLNNLNSTGGCFAIENNSVLDSLTGLESLSSVGTCRSGIGPFWFSYRGLSIVNNSILTDLSGLDILDSVEYLNISSNESLTSLNGLKNLHSVGKRITISDNNNLTSLEGMDSLSFAGSLNISDNSKLTSLNGMESLTTVGSQWTEAGQWTFTEGITISNNVELNSFKGLDILSYVEGNFVIKYNPALISLNNLGTLDSIGGCLNVENNDALSSFEGLEKVTKIGIGRVVSVSTNTSLYINNNDVLTSLKGLENINPVHLVNVYLRNCPNLSTCEVESICGFFENSGDAIVYENATGCNSIPEIEAACLVPVEELFENDLIQVYPNPTTGIIQIDIDNLDKWNANIRNALGMLIDSQTFVGERQIDFSAFPSGLYFLEMSNGSQSTIKRIIKE